MAENEDWPQSNHTTDGEEHHANPSNGFAVDGPEAYPVRVWQEIGDE